MKIFNRHGERVYLFAVTKTERTELKIRRQVGEAVIGLESLKILLPEFDALTGDTAKADIERVRAEQGIHPVESGPSKTRCSRCEGLHDPQDIDTCNSYMYPIKGE